MPEKRRGSDQSQAKKITSGWQNTQQDPTVVLRIGGLNRFCRDSLVGGSWSLLHVPETYARRKKKENTRNVLQRVGENAYGICSGCKMHHCDNVVALKKKKFENDCTLLCP